MAPTTRQQILESIKGQEAFVSGFDSIFKGWPQGVNPELDGMRLDVERRLVSLYPNHRDLPKLRKADFGLFAASWWPTADFEQLRIAAYVAIWLFVWDDEIDNAYGLLADNLKEAQIYRAETIKYVTHCLGFLDEYVGKMPTNPIITSFKTIGDEVCKTFTLHQRQVLLDEIGFFLQMSEVEQGTKVNNVIPSLEDYSTFRMGTSACGVIFAINEYSRHIEVPVHIMEDDDMKTLWDQANILVWIVNDILSIKKEIKQKTIDSMVPLLFREHGSLQIAVDSAMTSLQASVDLFNESARALLSRCDDDPATRATLQSFIDSCRCNITGNLHWSLRTGRYGICQEALHKGVSLKL